MVVYPSMVKGDPFKADCASFVGSNPAATIKQRGAEEACLAHNQKVTGSKPVAANYKIFIRS